MWTVGPLNSELLLNATRLLILIYAFDNRNSFVLNFDNIVLYDFYMKFPKTMLAEYNKNFNKNMDFNEYYSFYHWKPDRNRYHTFLCFLISKGLIIRTIKEKKYVFHINENGRIFVKSMQSEYAIKLKDISTIVSSKISKISNKKIEEEIIKKTLQSRDTNHSWEGSIND